MGWGGQGGGGQQPPHQGQPGLSVVTTVWGVTPSTQSGPFNQPPTGPGYTNTTMATPTPYNSTSSTGGVPPNNPSGFPAAQMGKNFNPQAGMGYNRSGSAPYNRPK